MAKTVKIDLRDHAGVPAGGAGMRRDRVTVWAPTFRPATGGDWTVGPQPVDYFFEDGVVNIPDVDAGPLVVRFDVDQMDGVDTFTVTVPAGDGVVTMRELLADHYEYAPIVISEARRVLTEARVLLEQSQDSAASAKSSKGQAAVSASEAASSASEAASSATAAKASEDAAASSASAAAASQGQAASSASGAKTSETKAVKSATAAASSASSAANAQTGAEAALTQAKNIASSTSWSGDKLTVNGQTSPSLTGPRGEQGPPGTTAWENLTGVPRPDLVSTAHYPMFIAHRGMRAIYPEHSMEAWAATVAEGFPLELDAKVMSDGEFAILHDDTVTRTMEGAAASKPIDMTRDQWKQATIKPSIPGMSYGTPGTLSEALDLYGGRHLLVIELKDSGTTSVQSLIDVIKARGLERAVILQSFTFDIAKQFASAGIASMFLCGASTTQTAGTVKAAGIEFFSPSDKFPHSGYQAYKDAGVRVVPYTINSQSVADSMLAAGADGMFSDDPIHVSHKHHRKGFLDFASPRTFSGVMPYWTAPNNHPDDRMSFEYSSTGSGISIPWAPFTTGINVVAFPSLGQVGGRVRISMVIDLFRSYETDSYSFGGILHKNPDPNYPWFKDNELAGQEGFTWVIRRNGMLQMWAYENGQKARSIKKTAEMPAEFQFSPAATVSGGQGLPGRRTLVIEFRSNCTVMECIETNTRMVSKEVFNLEGMTFAVRQIGRAEAVFSNVSITPISENEQDSLLLEDV